MGRAVYLSVMDATWIPWADALVLLTLIGSFTGTVVLTRTFVAHRKAQALWEPDRTLLTGHLAATERAAWWYMAWPCLVLLLTGCVWRIALEPGLMRTSWMQASFGVLGLYLAMHLVNGRLFALAQRQATFWTVTSLRAWSLVPGVLLVALVMLGTRREPRWYEGLALLLLGACVLLLVLRGPDRTTLPDADPR